MIEFSEVDKKFGQLNAVDKVSFSVSEGEFVFVTGPSGSGKTTIVRLILREILPTNGQVRILGKDTSKIKAGQVAEFRRHIGVVFQDFKLIHDLTVFENVALALRVRQVGEKEVTRRGEEILKLVELWERKNFFPSQLAGGELQRCCLARAVVGNPKILLADEPTGNLDPNTSWKIMKLLKLVNKGGTTILMATHNKEIVNSMRQRVICLEKGRVVKDEKRGKYTTS